MSSNEKFMVMITGLVAAEDDIALINQRVEGVIEDLKKILARMSAEYRFFPAQEVCRLHHLITYMLKV